MRLKLLVDKKGKRVLFAEATKEFVDFLFHIFSLPLGTLIEYLGSDKMVGCLGKLKDSIEGFQKTYFEPGVKKHDIFNPKTPFSSNTFLLSYDAASVEQEASACKVIYRCSNGSITCQYCARQACRGYTSLHANAKCPSCNGLMNAKTTVVVPKDDVAAAEVEAPVMKKMKVGFVKEVITYMVMDDLVVEPMSTISSITLISKFGVNDLRQLEEKTLKPSTMYAPSHESWSSSLTKTSYLVLFFV
nr:hypothetical protein [Tanacetum cinerariifolium]